MGTETTRQLTEAFLAIVDSVVGIQLDGTLGFQYVHSNFVQIQAEALRDPGVTAEYMDSRNIIHGIGDPTDPNAKILHTVSQGEYKARNAAGGSNPTFLTNLCAVSIYQFWEDHYRGEIAASLGKGKNELRVPVMGDLRYLRQSIIHNGGVAITEVERCEVLRWFKRGERIDLVVGGRFDVMVDEIQQAIRGVAQGT